MINLPFFFTYMMLQNGGNAVWIASLICSPFFLAWLTRPAVFAVLTLVGSGLAVLAYLADPHMPLDMAAVLSAAPVVLFAVTGGVLFKALESRNIEFNRTKSMALATSIAHELRTPILGARLDLDTARRALKTSRAEGVAPDEGMADPVGRIDFHLQKATHIVDNLLQNAKNDSFDASRFARCSAGAAISEALARYPFTPRQRGLVSFTPGPDFDYWGDELLMIHLLMNLIKNALTSLAVVQRGDIVIEAIPGVKANRIIVRDTGAGIAPHIRKRLFTQFFSAQGGGAGLGLAFCRRVARSFGGAIDCRSRPGEFAEFVVTLPIVTRHRGP